MDTLEEVIKGGDIEVFDDCSRLRLVLTNKKNGKQAELRYCDMLGIQESNRDLFYKIRGLNGWKEFTKNIQLLNEIAAELKVKGEDGRERDRKTVIKAIHESGGYTGQ